MPSVLKTEIEYADEDGEECTFVGWRDATTEHDVAKRDLLDELCEVANIRLDATSFRCRLVEYELSETGVLSLLQREAAS